MDIHHRKLHTWNGEPDHERLMLEVGKQGLPGSFGAKMLLSGVQNARYGARRFTVSSGFLSCFGSIFLLPFSHLEQECLLWAFYIGNK